MAVADFLVRLVEDLAETVQMACSGYWMMRDFHKIYALTEEDQAAA